jgi:hypothetical protein
VNFGNKVTYPIVSNFGIGPALAISDGSHYMGWRAGGGKITDHHVQRIDPTALMLTQPQFRPRNLLFVDRRP